jgi:hypothetical protein
MKGCNNVGILVGRNWLDVLVPKWRKAFAINSVENCFTKFLLLIKEKYQSVFQDNISEPIKEFKVDIRL